MEYYYNKKMHENCYIIQEREFIKTKEPIFKIGKTKQSIYKRMSGYPKGSEVLCTRSVKNCSNMEKILKSEFKKRFKQRTDVGIESYEGNKNQMIKLFNEICDNEISDNENDEITDSNENENDKDNKIKVYTSYEDTEYNCSICKESDCENFINTETLIENGDSLIFFFCSYHYPEDNVEYVTYKNLQHKICCHGKA